MAEYYLISQLPSLDGVGENTPLPITEERFLELCNRFLGKKAQSQVEKLTLLPSKDRENNASYLIEAWNESERNLRFALAKARSKTDTENKNLPAECIKTANTAAQMENPMEAEKYLSRYRLGVLETLRPMDSFSEDYIFYYGLKLKLLLRIRGFDTKAGQEAYRNIYNSVLSGDKLEAI